MERNSGMFRVALEELKHCYNYLYDGDLSAEEKSERDELMKLCARITNVEAAINKHFGDKADEARQIHGQLIEEYCGEERPFSWETDYEEEYISGVIQGIKEELPTR